MIPDRYNTPKSAHDILLIKLAHPAQFNGKVCVLPVVPSAETKIIKQLLIFHFTYNRLCDPDMLTDGQ